MRSPAALLLVTALLGGCAEFQPFDPPVAGEIPQGSGLFSGHDGQFVIFRREPAEPTTAERRAAGSPAADPLAERPLEPPAERDLTLPPPP